MKPPSKTLIAFALGLAASAATADMTAESSGGLDPLLVNTATNAGGNSPSMTCPTGAETGMVHVNARKGEFFVDFSQTPHKVRKADSAWVSLQDTSNPVVIAYNGACPPPVMAFSAMGLTNASAGFNPNSIGAGPSAASLGLGGGVNASGGVAGGSGPFMARSLFGGTPASTAGGPPAPGETAPNSGGSAISLNKLGGSMAASVGGGISPDDLGRSMGSAIGGFLGQRGSATGSGQRLGTTVVAAAPTASADGAAMQNTSNIPLTHRRTIQAAATMRATEDATFRSGVVSPNTQAPNPNDGAPVPLGTRITTNDN